MSCSTRSVGECVAPRMSKIIGQVKRNYNSNFGSLILKHESSWFKLMLWGLDISETVAMP